MKTSRTTIVLAIVVGLAVSCSGRDDASRRGDAETAEHVGREVCAECHRAAAASWEGSHHDLAMQPATPETVLGNFDGAEFVYAGVTTTFFRDGDAFLVRTDGADGGLADFEIAYTLGVEPLQQYLIEFPGGRLQALNIVWDTRPAEEGGQRWFHLYPDEAVDHEDILHWTGPLQNWNYMCAECHSTNLRKNYDPGNDTYDSTWSEIDVSCEACHGPGSRHVDRARRAARGERPNVPDLGLEVRLSDGDGASWIFDPGSSSARRDRPRRSHTQIESCARCHSRRTQLTDDYRHGRPLADTHRVALIEEPLYHADGQILDEVYVYGSFLQSAMYDNGVTCTDCHDPHTAGLRLEGNATCSPCHRQDHFDAPAHHFHPPESTGASCVACHMPSRDYMVIDPRHDHGFRVPRPDLSVKIGTPNACTGCHIDRSDDWAAETVAGWYGNERRKRPHRAEAIHAGRTRQPGAGPKLVSVIEDPAVPGIVRATALTLVRNYPTPGVVDAVRLSLSDPDPVVRLAATGTLEQLEPDTRKGLALGRLEDPIRTVRIEAARILASVARKSLTEPERAALDDRLVEYEDVQRFSADRAEGWLNLGWLRLQQGRPDEAERAYRRALRVTPTFSPAAINLADLYRTLGRDAEGEVLLREALERAPETPDLHHALGLLLARQKRYDVAIESLERASGLAPEQPRYAYVYAVALHSTGNASRALEILRENHERHPGHADSLYMLAVVSRDAGDTEAAVGYARELLEAAPGHPGALALLVELAAR